MDRTIIELMDDMHLSSRDLFLNYYYAMQSNNTSSANSILLNNPSLANQITNSQNVNYLISGINEREIEPKRDIDYYLDKLYQDFLVMINNTRVRGEFDGTVQYHSHNLVYYNGKGYYALKEPPIGTLPTNNEYWLEFDIRGFQGYGGLDLNLKFNWDNTIAYKKGDIVIYKNKMWYALADNTNYEPNLNHYPWVIISMPKMANKTPIQRATPTGYDIGDFWYQITMGDDVIQKKWNNKQQEITPRFASAGFVIGDKIYTVGGRTQTFVISNKTEVFDTVTNTWSEVANAPTLRARTTAFSIENKAYIIGGVDSNGNILDIVEEYDSITNTWTTKNPLPIPMVTSGISVGNTGYVIAGETTGNQAVDNSYSYNSTTDTWTAITGKITPTYGHALASDEKNIYAMGGVDQNGDTVGLNEAYDIETNTWSEKDDMLVPRSFLSAFFNNGSIYAVGGLNSDWYSLDANEKYDIEENKWITDTPMNYPRSSLNAMAVGTKGYAVGGINITTSDVHGYMEEYQVKDITSNYDMVIDTTLDSSDSKTISIPMVQGGTYNYWVDWGDGTSSAQITSYNDTNATHTYAADGEYTVRIIGNLDQLEYTGTIATCLKEVTKCNLAFSVIKNMFKNCVNLTNVVETIFTQTTIPTTAESVFEGCTKFGMIPVGLFDNMSGITSFKNTFKGTSVINIPTGLFDSNNSVIDFTGTFANCKRLVSIPTNIFKNNSRVQAFTTTFFGCISLTEIPNNLFNNNIEVTRYDSTFMECTGVKELPLNLFGEGAISATNFTGTFYDVPLTSLPAGLFSQAYSATNYDNVFNLYNGNIPANCFNGSNAIYENALDVEGIEEVGDNGLNGLALSSNMFTGDDQISSLKTLGENALWSKNVTSIVNQPTQMFRNNTTLTTIGNINFKPVNESMGGMFDGCTSLENVSGFFYGDNNEPSLAVDINFEDCPLTRDSLLNISDSLVTNSPTTIKNLTLGTENLAKLTAEEKLTIVNKYWNLVGYDIEKDISASGEGVYSFALDMVQKIKGDGSTQAQEIDLGAYLAETTLYCYVELVNKSTLEKVAMYAFEKDTGRFYTPEEIPVQEYFIWHSVTGERLHPVFLSKTVSGDTNGAILKEYLSNHNTEEYEILEIGDRYSSEIPTAGLQNVVNANRLFYHLSKVQDLTIYGEFKPKTMTELFVSNGEFLFEMNMLKLAFENLDLSICTNMSYAFAGLSKLTSWNFLNNLDTKNVEDMSGMFYNCSTLTSMQNLDMRNVKNTSYMYWSTGITEVLGNIIGNKVENAASMFSGTPIVKVPTDATTVFGHNNNLINVDNLFGNCEKLSNVGTHNVFIFVDDPTGMEPGDYQIDQTKLNNQLFTYCPNITSASQIFSGCKKLGDIPMGVFYHCSKLKDVSFAFAYSVMTLPISSTYICDVLFTNNLELENISYLFWNCQTDSVLTENKDGGHTLFPSMYITNASHLYDGYSATSVQGYENIPFVYSSPGLKDISYMFANQKVFRNLGDMFNDYSTWSWNKLGSSLPVLENCSYMFSNATELTGQGNKLVNELSKITTLTNHEKTFENCTKLSDYSSIPSDWK